VTGFRTNILANFAGQAAATLIQLAITPVYIRWLGVEAYGLIGFQITLQTLSQTLDFGVSPTVNRELARFTARSDKSDDSRDFVRTLEVGYWLMGAAIGLAVYAAAPYLSAHWFQRSSLPAAAIEQAIKIMAILIAVQWPLTLYQGGLLGLQRHRSLNVARVAATAAAAVGGYIVVSRVSPTVTAFFWWQSAVNLAHVGLVAGLLWHSLPSSPHAPRVRLSAVRHTRRFAAGMTVIMVTAIVLAQLDRIVVSRLVSLEQFGYFVVAGIVGYGLSAMARPVFMSIFPKFSALAASGDERALSQLYEQAWQLMMIVIVPAAAVIAAFSGEVLFLWTNDAAVAHVGAPIAAFLTVGTALNGLMNVPYALQLAHGWTRLAVKVNFLLLLLAVPAIVVVTPRYGTLGAATIWPAINLVFMLVAVPITHRRLLPGMGVRWFLRAVALPVSASVLIAMLCRLAMNGATNRAWIIAEIMFAWFATGTALILASVNLRRELKRWTLAIANYARTRSFEASA
jgi:O-antigen/teichoic acid export membrane protein